MDDDDDQMNLEESVVTAGMSIDFEVAGENWKVAGKLMRTLYGRGSGGRLLRPPEALG